MTCPSPASGNALALASKVAFLRQPSSFAEAPYRVEALETHMAWVFLTTHYAYKLKKPVCYELLDFRTLDARRHMCDEEVRLNRRLAPTVYLGVLPLTLEEDGHLALGGTGAPVDWLVRMRRLPSSFMLDYMIRHGQTGTRGLDRVAAALVAFYQSLPPVEIAGATYRERIARHLLACQRELHASRAHLPGPLVRRVCLRLRLALRRQARLFDQRAADGMIVEGHGDLRPEHICLYPDVLIIDCLEFSRTLRTVDRADEIAFLALETERMGAPQVGLDILLAYRALSSDHPPPALLRFYKSYRAVVRATLAIRHLREEQFRYSPKWAASAMDYLRLAEQHSGPQH